MSFYFVMKQKVIIFASDLRDKQLMVKATFDIQTSDIVNPKTHHKHGSFLNPHPTELPSISVGTFI